MAKNDDPDIERLKEEMRRIREVVRPARIEDIIRIDCKGSRRLSAERIGKPENYISRMRPNSAGSKSIGEETAYIIEQTFRKPRGWLDGEPRDEIRDTPPTPYLTDRALAFAQSWESLHEPLRTQIEMLVTTLSTPQPMTKPRKRLARAKGHDAAGDSSKEQSSSNQKRAVAR